MRRIVVASAVAITLSACARHQAQQTQQTQPTQPAQAAQPAANGPYKVLQRAKVGGEGGTDYIYADPAGRRLYITRGAARGVPASGTTPEVPAFVARITIFDLETIKPLGEIPTAPNRQGNGVAVDPKSGHGFTSSSPGINMFDTKSMQMLKSIPIDSGVQPDGIYFDSFNDRVYVFSHPTKDATVIDSKEGKNLGRIALGGVPEQGVGDGKGTLYVVMQAEGNVAVVDAKTMKTTAHYPFGENTGCNGLALDIKNQVLFAACSRNAPAAPAGQPQPTQQPMMVILSAKDGKILAKLPLAGSSDGSAFNPATMEAFSTGGNGTLTVVKEKSPTSFEVEQNLQTMNGARTIAFDPKTGRLFAMASEQGPPPPTPPGGAGGRGGGRGATIPGSFTILVIGK
jgi:DNA-binding beta-propeller fold protein YncE